jgi:Rod binding domain-containing protein
MAINPLAAAGLPAPQMDQIKTASKDFEAVFISEMMKHMFEGVKTDPVFGGGAGEDMFRSMLIQEYGKNMAHNGNGIGIATEMQKSLIQMTQQKG